MSEGNSPNVSEEEVKAESVEKDMESTKDMDAEDNVQEEEVEEPSEDKESEEKVELTEDEEPQLGLLERPVVIESGKREKRKVERLEISVKTPNDKQILIPEGSGQKLGDSPRVEYQLNRVKAEDLKIVHRALFDRPGSISTIKKNIRKFNGFDFGKDDKRFEKKRAQLSKNTTVILKKMCEILDLERSGSKEDILNRLMDFLLEPKSSGKSVPKPKQKRKSSDGKQKSKAKKNNKKKSAPKKKTSDSSDSSDSEEENEKSSTTTTSSSSISEESEESEEEKPKKKKRKVEKKKSSKKQKKVEKKKKPTPKKVEKKSTPKKRKISESTSDSSDDEPIIKKKKSPPSDDDIHEDVKKILEGANLEEVTMKTVIKQVYAKYPDFDLTPRKEFIKSTVKQIIS